MFTYVSSGGRQVELDVRTVPAVGLPARVPRREDRLDRVRGVLPRLHAHQGHARDHSQSRWR